MYKIVIVSGSARLGRQTPKAVSFLQKILSEHSAVEQVRVLDVKDFNFPIMEERRGRNPNPPPRLDEFGDALEEADALVFASPEYNGSFSGSLKNTLDYFYKEYSKKPIGIMTVAAGAFSGVNASHDLQKYILTLGGFPMPKKLLVGRVGTAFDDEGNPAEERLKAGFDSFIDELLWLTEAITNQKNR